MRYSRRTLNCPKIIALFDLTHIITMVDPITMNEETPMIDSGCSLKKEFTKLIYMNL